MPQILEEKSLDTQHLAEEKEIKPYNLKFSQKVYVAIKAIADFCIAFVALLILIPVFIITAVAIKIDSKGPVFFVQKRVGKDGKEFNCVKFRSMAQNARHDVAGYEYADVQSYITRVGKFIRKTSIDELPQLFCLLTFKMSLIGYRPSQSNEYELNEAREAHNMYQIRPGISGWAQVNGRDVLAAQPKKKAAFDAYYLEHISLWLDIKIFFMTIVAVLGHSGIAEGEIKVAADSGSSEASESTETKEEAAV